MTILTQDPKTGYWNKFPHPWGGIDNTRFLRTHTPDQCEGRLCDVHNRRGEGEQATWPLNWRSDRGIMEVICPCGTGHPTPAQEQFLYWLSMTDQMDLRTATAELVHGCCVIHCPLATEEEIDEWKEEHK